MILIMAPVGRVLFFWPTLYNRAARKEHKYKSFRFPMANAYVYV